MSELRVDHVDLLFLHDPYPTDDICLEEILPFLEGARATGKIRCWGVSQNSFPNFDLYHRLGPEAVLQQRHDALDEQAPLPGAIAFGVLGAAHQAIAGWLRQDPARRWAWASKLDADPLSDGLLAALLLSRVLAESSGRVILYSSTKADRLSLPGQLLVSPFPIEQLSRFDDLLAHNGAAIRAGGRAS